MLMWLITWRQKLMMLLLILIIGLTVLPANPSLPSKQVLAAGWWIEQEQQAHLTKTVVSRHITPPDWWFRFWPVWQWVQSGLWLSVSGGLLWYLIPASGPSWQWLGLLMASHKLRTQLREHCIELSWKQQIQEVAQFSSAMTELARTVDEAEMDIVVPTEGSGSETVSAPPVSSDNEQTKPNCSPVQGEERSVVAVSSEAIAEPIPVAEGEKPAAVPKPVAEMMSTLTQITEGLPIGTNLAMLHFLWMMTSGQLLASRGALFPALQAIDLEDEQIRRAWAAFRAGSWQISDLLAAWQAQVEAEGLWQEHRYEGYRPIGVDITAFWRPTLQGCPSKHYYAQAGKALPAIIIGMISRVGSVGSQRIPLPRAFIRVDEADPSEATLQSRLIEQVVLSLAADEIAILDAGFQLKALHEAGLKRYVVRLAKNFVGRCNHPAPYKGQGRKPEYGEKVRPLARVYDGRTIEATPPDHQFTWDEGKLSFKADIWENLVLSDQKPGAQSFNVVAIHDPRYKEPWLVATSLEQLSHQTIRALYRDRWPVEQLPLSAKQMIGAHRQFVHAPESCQRLPELALFAGSILTHVAAKLPPVPTGFWDRAPKPTPGRLRRVLTDVPFPAHLPLPARIRQKASVTDHLPKGVLAHRRQSKAKQPV